MEERIRLLLADDHAILRAGLKALLNAEPDMEVVGEAADGLEALQKTEELKPDVVLMDIAMPGLDGIECTRRIQEMACRSEPEGCTSCCKVLVLTMHAEEQYLLKMLRSGASGYVLKQSADKELIEAIRTVHRGDVFLYPSAVKMLMQDYLEKVKGGDEREKFNGLSEREREVLRLTAAGYSNHEIAERLCISSKTVDTYRSRIMEKLNLHRRSELVRYALQKGLLSGVA